MLPILYIVGAGVVGAAGYLMASRKGFGFWGSNDPNKEPIKDIRLAVLGPSLSGKTTFLNNLTKNEAVHKVSEPTSITGERIEEKELTKDGKTIKLLSTTDVPGSKASIILHYDKLINICDYIFFIFDCNEFLKDKIYQTTTMALIDFTIRHNKKGKRLIFIGSHADKLHDKPDSEKFRKKDTESVVNVFINEFDGEKIKEIELVNLLNSDEVSYLKSMLFK